jgi:hypothetical protein
MRLCIPLIVLLLVASSPATPQNAAKAAKAIDTIEDVEIGMSADTVISALTKKGYTLVDAFKTGDPAQWNVSLQDKYLGLSTLKRAK